MVPAQVKYQTIDCTRTLAMTDQHIKVHDDTLVRQSCAHKLVSEDIKIAGP